MKMQTYGGIQMVIHSSLKLIKLNFKFQLISGPYKPLLDYNELRVPWVIEGMQKVGRKTTKDLNGLKLLDVGCGAGIFSEALAIEGAEVVGIDPGEDLIRVARNHKMLTLKNHPKMKLSYEQELIEDHAEKFTDYYDVVVTSEVIEHVPDPKSFIKHCMKALKPGGTIFVTTLNRTFASFFWAWLVCDFILGKPKRGTHSYWKFVKPEEIEEMFIENNGHKVGQTGFMLPFSIFNDKAKFCDNTSVCFGIYGVKNMKL
jgi:ubiquinone biosynthesis O-methyltransferase